MDKRLEWADAITLKRIELMHPKVKEELIEQYLTINTRLPKGCRLRITHTYRTAAEQTALYNQGRTAPGVKVTNAKAGESIHNYGLAFDIVLMYDKAGNGKFDVSWAVDANWKRVAEYFKSVGWNWGGDWTSFKDNPHFEKRFGLTTKELASKPKIKINGIEYPSI